VTLRRAPGGAVLVALAIGLSLGLAPVTGRAAGPAATPAAVGPAAAPAAPAPVPKPHVATLARQTPWAAPDGDLHLGLAVTGPADGLTVQIQVHRAVISRSALAQSLEGRSLGGVEGRLEAPVSGRIVRLGVSIGDLVAAKQPVAFITPEELDGVWIRAPDDPVMYARMLYANLRALDAANADSILIEQVPGDPAWNAIRDRLARATSGQADDRD